MRICIVNEFFWPDSTGGTGTVLSDLARTLRQNYSEVEIDVITSRNLYRPVAVTNPKVIPAEGQLHFANVPNTAKSTSDSTPPIFSELPERESWQGINIFRLKTPRPNGLSTPKRLIANLAFTYASLFTLLRSKKYDLILVGTAPPMLAMAANAFRKVTGTPYVYIVYDLEPDRAVALKLMPPSHPAVGLLRRGQKTWFNSAKKVVVLGRCMRDYLRITYQVPQANIDVIPVGADHVEIQPLSKNTRFREQHDLDGFVLLYSGNFGRYHDFDTVLEAAKILSQLRNDVHFVLVGGGWQLDKIQQRITDEKIDNVTLHPFVAKEDYADLLATADASLVTLEPGMDGLCVPSKFYSILASGRATIAVVPPSTEVGLTLEEAQCGMRIDHGNVQMLVDAVLYMANNPGETARMGRNARRVLEEQLSTSDIAHAYYRTFASAIGAMPDFVPKESEPQIKNDVRDEAETIASTH